MKAKLLYYLFVLPRIIKYKLLSDNIVTDNSVIQHCPCLFSGKGIIKIGRSTVLGIKSSPHFYSHYSYFEARSLESEIIIGNHVFINNNCSIVVDKSSVEIKDKVLIGTNCNIMDSDFHNLHPEKRHQNTQKTQKVTIHKNVFIGNNVTILKGVSIGENSVIGANSVVSKSIPENVIALGNPCRILKKIDV
ncbi:DapH/DapD/GlmU-related protein [Wenyingzhuangia sp. IMCC45533]